MVEFLRDIDLFRIDRVAVSGVIVASNVPVISAGLSMAGPKMITEKNFLAENTPTRISSNSPTPIFIKTVAIGFRSGIRETLQAVARNDAEWLGLRKRHALVQSNSPPLPDIDFEKEMVAAVFLGDKPTGGYAVEIVRSEKTKGLLTISFREQSPRPGSIQTQAFVQPFHIVSIPGTNAEEVVFWRLP